MLTRLHLKGFKSWRDTGDIGLRPLTAIFGTNSSGKTSLLQSLLLLKQTADSPDRSQVFQFGDGRTLADLGDFRSTVHRHVSDSSIHIGFDWMVHRPMRVTDSKNNHRLVAASKKLGFSVQAEQRATNGGQSVAVAQMAYRLGDVSFRMNRSSGDKLRYGLTSSGTDFSFVRAHGVKWPLPAPNKCYGFPDAVRAYFQNAGFVADLELALEKRLDNIYYLGPLRAYPERRYTWTGGHPEDMGRTGESVVDALLASRARGDKISRGQGIKRATLEQYVAEWLMKIRLIHDFRVDPVAKETPIFEVKVRRSRQAAEVLLPDVGFGVSQILPVLVLCFYVPTGSTVILEQPEIHLHPSAQAGLADILIDAWQKRQVQVIVESHSEHLLRRLQRRIAENKIPDSEVGLYFCEPGTDRSRITGLELDEFGNIGNWPKDFFGDQFGEIAATDIAALERRHRRSE